MKTLLITLLTSTTLFSQNTNSEKMNIVKTNVTAYAFKNINLTYERVINQKFSINVGFGTVAKGTVPFSSSYIKDSEISDAEVSLTNFTIEPRIYLGKGYGRGFYFAPYYRYTSFTLDNITLSEDLGGGKGVESLKVSGKATGNSGGLMIGAQWFLGQSENWVLDLWIVGAHYGAGKGDFDAKSNRNNLTANEQKQLKEKIDGLTIPLVKYETTTNNSGATIKVDGPWAGLRTGLSFGYRF
jgi:hypothetical protein